MKYFVHLSLVIIMAAMLIVPHAQAELIILASPESDDPYYAEMHDDIFDFHVVFARKIIGRDHVIILTDEGLYDDYIKALGEDHVVIAPMPDIWMRDFSTANPTKPVKFRYTAAGQGSGKKGQAEADAVQEELTIMTQEAGLSFVESNLLNDGGNFRR